MNLSLVLLVASKKKNKNAPNLPYHVQTSAWQVSRIDTIPRAIPANRDIDVIKVYLRYEKLQATSEASSFVILHEITFGKIKAELIDTNRSGRSRATLSICSESELRFLSPPASPFVLGR